MRDALSLPVPVAAQHPAIYYECRFCNAFHALFFTGACHDADAGQTSRQLDARHGEAWRTIAERDIAAERIRVTGEACFGMAWLEPLAEALHINPRTLQRAMAGKATLPTGAWFDLGQLRNRALALAAEGI